MGPAARGAGSLLGRAGRARDHVPFGIGQALGLPAGGNRLGNTLRLGRVGPTEWALLDIRVHQLVNEFGPGDVHLWTQSGTLLATASQSTIVRMWRDMPGGDPRDR